MAFEQVIVSSASIAPQVPMQFGGDLIGLAILFLVLAVLAAILGARGVAGLSMDIAKWLVIIFVVLAVVTYFL